MLWITNTLKSQNNQGDTGLEGDGRRAVRMLADRRRRRGRSVSVRGFAANHGQPKSNAAGQSGRPRDAGWRYDDIDPDARLVVYPGAERYPPKDGLEAIGRAELIRGLD